MPDEPAPKPQSQETDLSGQNSSEIPPLDHDATSSLVQALKGAQAPSPYMIPGIVGINPAQPGMVIGQASMQVWQGQFPPPQAIESYERTLPGCFDRMMKMAERQQEIQADQATNALKFTSNDTRRGHWLGFSGLAIAMIFAFLCFWKGLVAGGVAFLGVPVFTVIKSLIDSAKKPSPENVAKAIVSAQTTEQRRNHGQGD